MWNKQGVFVHRLIYFLKVNNISLQKNIVSMIWCRCTVSLLGELLAYGHSTKKQCESKVWKCNPHVQTEHVINNKTGIHMSVFSCHVGFTPKKTYTAAHRRWYVLLSGEYYLYRNEKLFDYRKGTTVLSLLPGAHVGGKNKKGVRVREKAYVP